MADDYPNDVSRIQAELSNVEEQAIDLHWADERMAHNRRGSNRNAHRRLT